MRPKTPGQTGDEVHQRGERGSVGLQSTTRGGANDQVGESQRTDKLGMLPTKLLRFTDVRERTGLSRSTVWRLERRGAFPKHIKVSANIVAWLEQDVVEWIRSKARQLVA
jgi:prophage regulatory protein